MRIDWIKQGLLAGSPQPGLLESLDQDTRQLRDFGFKLIVNLTETPYELSQAGYEFEHYHFPILDMGTPVPRAMAEACETISTKLEQGIKTLVHCKAGLGRTGTLLACFLVYEGQDAEKAVTEIRLINSRFIQNRIQERFVHHFAEFLAAKNEIETATGEASLAAPETAETA